MDNIITEIKRSELPDSAFGIPEERKYPLHDEKHVRSAIKLFNHVDQKYEKQLANKIIAKMKEYDITPNIGDNNRLKKYINESHADLTKFTWYHAEIAKKGFNAKTAGGWDEELYSKSIESCIHNDIEGKAEFKGADKISAHLYTAGEDLSAIYLGRISIWRASDTNKLNWEWEEQIPMKSSDVAYLKDEVQPHLLESYIYEGIVKNEKDIYYNKEKFDSGEINLCFITGHSGSGKSTMGRGMAKDNIEHYELDDLIQNYNFSDDNLKEYGDLIYSFFKGPGKKYRYYSYDDLKKCTNPLDDSGDEFDKCVNIDFINYAIKYAKSHPKTKFVIEGIWIFFFIAPDKLKDYAVYIKGTSHLVSSFRAAKRDSGDEKDKIKRFIYTINGTARNLTDKCRIDGEKAIKKYRDYFSKKSLNESLETILIHPTLPKKVNIYHGTYSKDFKTIEPTSYNNGTKLSTSRMSSFWFIEMEYAKAFSVMEIINRNKNDDKIPMMLDKNLLVAVPAKYRNHVIDILKKTNSYVYAKKNIESKYLGVGQGKGFPEYTLDVSVKPDSIYTLSYPDNLQYVSFKSDSEIAELKEYYKTNRPSLLYYTADQLKQRREYIKGLNESSVEDYLDDDEWDEIEEWTPVSFLSKKTSQAKNKKAHRDYLKRKQKSHKKKYNFFHKHEAALYEDMKNNITDAEPIFIVNSFTNTPFGKIITTYTHSNYSHTAISLDTSLTHMYSFNADNKKNVFGGFSIESIKDYIAYYKDSVIQVNCIFIKKSDMDKIKFVLDNMTEHIPDTRYGFKNIFNIVLNKTKEMTNDAKVMVCSQFVSYILHNTADIRLVDKSDNLVTPKDLSTLTNPRVYKLYEGKAVDYDEKKINRIFRKLKTKAMIIKESLIDY